ncbi:MAG: hypothetical protein CMO74_12880 [Verrucomicrobiales bacterium]|nr:hypothetical protein [Verrucomicrobiales bacterium]|tara:strand:+ start:1265 stop:2101 length:837 start_codon:yes stop_codon:yes gene_type:complete
MGKLSCVIPTLGGKRLESTLCHLLHGSLTPDEVLVCLPEGQELAARIDFSPPLREIRTEKRGQVAQRAKGFQMAAGEWVLQLDDDVALEEQCLETLLNYAKETEDGIALAPVFLGRLSSKPLHREKWKGFFNRVNLFIMNGRRGFQPGKVTLSGHCFGPRFHKDVEEIQEVEWVSGGCVLHNRRNLITKDYFPFHGKAYCEDLIHSHHLREKGINLKVCSGAKCYTEAAAERESLGDWVGEYRARKYYQRLRSSSWLRMHIWYLAVLMRRAIMKITGK